jgi:hypothetical protein
MAYRTNSRWILSLLLLAKLSFGHAEELHLTVGLKTWINSWTSWGVTQTSVGQVDYDTVTPLTSDMRVSAIPQLSVRYGRWLASASYTASTTYRLSSRQPNTQPDSALQRVIGARSEADGTVGYLIVPELAVLVGYKELDRNFGADYRWSGPIVGLSTSTSLNILGCGVYATVFYGPFQLRLPQEQPDASGRTKFDANYVLMEAGLAYSFKRHFTVSVGYRSQTVKTSGYALAATPLGAVGSAAYGATDLVDFTQGPTLSVADSF